MKNKIKPFIQRLIQENIFYILGNILIFILILINIKVGLSQNFDYNKKVSDLGIELNQLKNKVTLMRVTIPSSQILDEDLIFLNTLIPNVEDYFSITHSLEKLSEKSNFIITSYDINVSKSSVEKLKLSVTGIGDSESFINFLKDYNFGGGRLITSDRIQLEPNFFSLIKIDLTFYSKSASTSQSLEVEPNGKVFQELQLLKDKAGFSPEGESAINNPSLNYPKKSNPF
jgi:hypothetical protein